MLNDLLEIERALTGFGVALLDRHPDIKDMAKGPAILARIGSEGAIRSVEVVREAGNGAVWTLRDGQHNGFPGLKMAGALLQLDAAAQAAHQAAWEADKSPVPRRAELLRLLAHPVVYPGRLVSWPSPGHRARIGERLRQLAPLADDPRTAAVPAVFARFLAATEADPPFLVQLATALGERLRNGGDEWLDLVRAALTGAVALAIDAEELEFDRDAGDSRQIGAVSAALSGALTACRDQDGGGTACALSGDRVALHAGNFPQPNLPGLGQTYIFSRNRDIPSLTRFGRSADASFPVGAALVRRLSGAVSLLTRPDRKGQTWRLVAGESGDKPDLLVVSLADPDFALADALNDDEEEGSGEAALLQLASRVIRQSDGEVDTAEPEGQVTILILRTVDPANRKVIYHRRTRSADLWHAAARWQAATRNVPGWLGFPVPVKGEPRAPLRPPPYVSPLSLTPLSRTMFERQGRRRVEVNGATASDAFQLFLHEPGLERRAADLLHLVLRRHGPLLGGIAMAARKGMEALKAFDPKADLRRDALRSTTWIGALLHHLGRDAGPAKESYMSDAGFRLGQLLAVADTVHVGYCMDVRGGSIPTSLLGNAVLGLAAERPSEALKLLCQRWPPYATWTKNGMAIDARLEREKREAKSDSEKKTAERRAVTIRTALSHSVRVKEIAAALAEQLPDRDGRTTDLFQAELLLGYMAGLPPSEKKPEGDQTSPPQPKGETSKGDTP